MLSVKRNILALLLFVFLVPFTVGAQHSPSTVENSLITEAFFTEETDSGFVIQFTLQNYTANKYTNINYGVVLKRLVADEAAIPSYTSFAEDVLAVEAGGEVVKTFTYDFSDITPGEYEIWFVVQNELGLLGDYHIEWLYIGDGTVSVSIVGSRCVFDSVDGRLPISFETTLDSTKDAFIICPVQSNLNEPIVVSPSIAIRDIDNDEYIGFVYPVFESFTLYPTEEASIRVPFPADIEYGKYQIEITLEQVESNSLVSNKVSAAFNLSERTEEQPVVEFILEDDEQNVLVIVILVATMLICIVLYFYYRSNRPDFTQATKIFVGFSIVFAASLFWDTTVVEAQSRPACSIPGQPFRTVHTFTGRMDYLNARMSEAVSRSIESPFNLPAGAYDIYAHAWDGYPGRESTAASSQRNERYNIALYNSGGAKLVLTSETPDLRDGRAQDTWIGMLNSNVDISQNITKMIAQHSRWQVPSSAGSNSVHAICAAFDLKSVIGSIDGANSTACSVSGWAVDPKSSNTSIAVHVYRDGPAGGGGTLVRVCPTNIFRSDINNAYGITGNHGFNCDLSGLLTPNKNIGLYIHAIDTTGGGTWPLTNRLLTYSPKHIYCEAPPAPPTPVVSLTATPNPVEPGGTANLTWSATNATSCTASSLPNTWNGAKSSTGGTEPVTAGSYTLTCTGPGGSASQTYVVTTPTASISATGCTISVGGTSCNSNVSWNSSYFLGAPAVNQGGAVFSSSASSAGVVQVVTPDNRTFTIEDQGSTYSRSASATVPCEEGSFWISTLSTCVPLPAISIISNPGIVRSGNVAPVEITVDSDYELECTFSGGLSETFTHSGTPSLVTYTRDTRPLRSAQIVTVSCVSPIHPTLTGESETRIEVIPSMQEV